MKTLYIDCSMGASGDMLAGALLDLMEDSTSFVNEFNKLNIPNVKILVEPSIKCGISGKHFNVQIENNIEHEHKHEHFHLEDLLNRIRKMDISDKVKNDIKNVYELLAEAESQVHKVPVKEIHLHEVGNLDALSDISAVCMLIDKISPEKIISSPVHVGSGQVKCAHGILPVPAPATALLLKDIPIYGGEIKSELCTPTGAALLKYFVSEFSPLPEMSISSIGNGMGTKDFENANCLRMFLGTSKEDQQNVLLLECNIDDMTAEDLGYAQKLLLSSKALDVFTTPIQMKNNRPGTLLSVLCKPKDREKFVQLIFNCTSTIGIREHSLSRYVLERREEQIVTKYGTVRKKISTGYGLSKEKYEHSDLEKLSQELGTSIEGARSYLKNL